MRSEQSKTTEQKAAEANVEAFRKDLGPFVAAAEMTRMPMVFTDAKEPGDPIIFVNDSFLFLTGYDREEVLGQSFNFLMALGTDAAAIAEIQAAFEGRCDNDPKIKYRRKDGSMFWATIFISPVLDQGGDVVQHFASFMDITSLKLEQQRLRLLLAELNHRTQNTLATVQGIAEQTLRGVADEIVIKTLESRILALAKAHSLLGREDWAEVGLRDVIDQIFHPFHLNDHGGSRVSISGGNVRLPPRATLTLAMVFHELATNAAKYGALSNVIGRIAIAWQTQPTPQGDRMELQWRESDGPLVKRPHHKGFGSRLIEGGLAQELDGEVHIDYAPEGVVCRIVMPVSEGSLDE